jgi:hypothetical protein
MPVYVAQKVLKVGQTHYQPGESVPGAERLSNLQEMISGGHLAPAPVVVEAAAPTVAPILLSEELTPTRPWRPPEVALPTPSPEATTPPPRPPVITTPAPSPPARMLSTPAPGKKSKPR